MRPICEYCINLCDNTNVIIHVIYTHESGVNTNMALPCVVLKHGDKVGSLFVESVHHSVDEKKLLS